MVAALQVAQFLAADPIARAQSGQTAHGVIHRQGASRLLFFPCEQPRHTPVLVVMPLINTWTIFDLLPGRSVVEALVSAGVPVYLLDWGAVGPQERHRTLSELVDERLGRALHRATRHAGQVLDVLGYCVGGTFLAMHVARHAGCARRMALLCSPIDFHASGRLARWATPDVFPVDVAIDCLGNYPAEIIKSAFAWLNPMGQWHKWATLAERIEDPDFRALWAALEKWSRHPVDFPGEAYRAYVKGCYFDNALIEGGWLLNGEPVDLAKGSIEAHVITASRDHICEPAAAEALAKVWGGSVTLEQIAGGHVGVCVGRRLPEALLRWVRA
jgi:polyhydroxyalkanoate synthase